MIQIWRCVSSPGSVSTGVSLTELSIGLDDHRYPFGRAKRAWNQRDGISPAGFAVSAALRSGVPRRRTQ